MQKAITNLGGHPCIPNEHTRNSWWRCLRCHADSAWHTRPCTPGLTVHLPPSSPARRHWLAQGFLVDTLTEHPRYHPCMDCYDPENDLTRRSIPSPAQMPGKGYDILWPGTASGTPVYHNGYTAWALWAIDWPPHTHTGYARKIAAAWWARQVVTTRGSFWYGHAPDSRWHSRAHNHHPSKHPGFSFIHDREEPEYRTGTDTTAWHLPQLPQPNTR